MDGFDRLPDIAIWCMDDGWVVKHVSTEIVEIPDADYPDTTFPAAIQSVIERVTPADRSFLLAVIGVVADSVMSGKAAIRKLTRQVDN